MGLVRTALPFIGTVIALTAAGGASAQQRTGIPSAPVWYAGVGAGVSYYNLRDQDFNIASIASIPGGQSSVSSDATGFGWKIFGGYRFNPYFALEGSYVDLGNTTITVKTFVNGVPTFLDQSKYAVHSYNVAAVGRIPFANGFSLQGKLGAAFTRAQNQFTGTPGVQETHYKTNLLLGAGAGYDFANGVTILGEAEYFGRVGNATSVNPFPPPGATVLSGTGRSDAYLFSVSTMFRF